MDKTLLEMVDAQFGFCHEMIKGKGEDSWCYSLNEQAGIFGVFDGCGGLGAASYKHMRMHTGAYLASRACAAGAMQWFDSYYTGQKRDADSLKRQLQRALSACLGNTPPQPGGLRGSMVRSLPTTMALWLLETDERGLSATSFSAGDSRTYLLNSDGIAQISSDDILNEDAMSNLYHDAAMTNVVAADGRFSIKASSRAITEPCVLISATDGCFGYYRSPMEFEYVLLDTLQRTKCIDKWNSELENAIGEVAGDDQSFAAVVIGYGSYMQLQNAMSGRWRLLKGMLSEFDDGVDSRQKAWEEYKSGYYRLTEGGIPNGG